MRNKISGGLKGLLAVAHVAVPAAALSLPALAQDVVLPSPYLSPALDAVLIPIDDAVIESFELDSSESGVLVLAVEPGGVADEYGIEPGDILREIGGNAIATPQDVDVWVWTSINEGSEDFTFDVWRAGAAVSVAAVVTLELFEEVTDFSTIESWSSWESESFSYSEFVSEYSSEIETSYEEFSSEESSEVTEESSEEIEASDEGLEEEGTDDDDLADDGAVNDSDEDSDDGDPSDEDGGDDNENDAADDTEDESEDGSEEDAGDEADDGSEDEADDGGDEGADDGGEDEGGSE